MSLSDKRAMLRGVLALGVLTMPISGCFRPMLAKNSSASDIRGRIALPKIDDRLDYHLYQSLEEELGRPGSTEYRLEVTVGTRQRDFAVSQDSSVTRLSVVATAYWKLFKNGIDEPIYESKAVSESGYNATGSLYATRQTEIDVERRIAVDLGKRIGRAILARSQEFSEIT